MKKGRIVKRISIAVAAVIAVYLVLSAAAAVVIPRVMFPRSDGTTRFSLTYGEKDAEAYPREEFSFTSCGRKLYGWLYRGKTAEKGLVVIVNGFTAGADAHLAHVRAFCDDGWAVASYDGTGIGKSEGDGVVGLAQVKLDLFAFLDFAAEDPRFSYRTTVLLGHSAGGYASACALARDYGIDAVAVFSAFDSPVETMTYHAHRLFGLIADAEYPFIYAWSRLTFGRDADEKAHDAISASDVPVLVVSGSEDDTVPGGIGLCRFSDGFPPNVISVTVDGDRGRHSTEWLSGDAAGYVTTVPEGTEADREFANELDPDMLALVIGFFTAATEGKTP